MANLPSHIIYEKSIAKKLKRDLAIARRQAKEALYMRHSFPVGVTYPEWIKSRAFLDAWAQSKDDAERALIREGKISSQR